MVVRTTVGPGPEGYLRPRGDRAGQGSRPGLAADAGTFRVVQTSVKCVSVCMGRGGEKVSVKDECGAGDARGLGPPRGALEFFFFFARI